MGAESAGKQKPNAKPERLLHKRRVNGLYAFFRGTRDRQSLPCDG